MVEPSTRYPESTDAPLANDVTSARRVAEESAKRALPSWGPWLVLAGVVGLGSFVALRGSSREPKLEAIPAVGAPASPSSAAAAPSAPADATEWFSAEHLVVSHKDTKLGAKHRITRSLEDARTRAEEARSRALKGEDFSKLVREYSDEPTLEQTNGILVSFRYKDAVKPFADAVVAIQPGQISAVAETNLGFHVIKRLPYKRK
jgi:hypothetical protein